jgi:UDPglucose--hexose-1-phosphate uridylyltransferase
VGQHVVTTHECIHAVRRAPSKQPAGEPEFRLDALTGRWVAVTGPRQHRPNLPSSDSCPFCVGGLEAETPYTVKAFANRWPALVPGDPVSFESRETLERGVRPARGAAEVVLYTPDHNTTFARLDLGQARAVVDLWAERTAELLARPEIEYVLVFENNGAEVGATIGHPHGQIYAFPFVPPVPALEARVAAEIGCPICSELERDLRRLVVERNHLFVAFARAAADWPFELIVAPVEHRSDLQSLDYAHRDALAQILTGVLGRYERLFGQPIPYMMWIHPGVHLHVHLVTTRRQASVPRYVAAGELGSGVMFNPVAPEDAAEALRAAVLAFGDAQSNGGLDG